MRAASLLVIAACGRIGFDGIASDARPDACAFGPWSAPVPLPAIVQSMDDDWGATPTLAGSDVYFYSFRNGAGDSDIWHAVRPTATTFAAPVRVAELATARSEGTLTLTDDALEILFAREGDILEATRGSTAEMFGAATTIAINSPSSDGDPFVSADGLRLVFASSRIGPDVHGLDLFEATRPSRSAEFGAPVELHELNTDNDDFAPTLSADGLEIFFASRTIDHAPTDEIYTARRPALDRPFDAPVVVPELSSARDDVLPRLSLDDTTIYLDYNTITAGGANADLYSATRSCN